MLMRIPRRHLPAAVGVVAAGVFVLATAACAVLASERSGPTRVALVLLCVAGALCTLGIAAGIAMAPRARRWLSRNVISGSGQLAEIAKAQRSTRTRVAELQRMVGELPGRRVVRSVDTKAAAALERSDEVYAELIRLQAAVKALPDAARLHKLFEVTSKKSATSIENLRSESEQTRKDVASTRKDVASTRNDVTSARKDVASIRKDLAAARQAIATGVERSDRSTMRHVRDLYVQVDGLAALYAMLGRETDLPPLLAEWAIGADLAAYLVRHVRRTRPSTIVELGGGVSTVLLAMAVRENGHGRVVSLDHDPYYADRTGRMLDEYGVAEWVTNVVAPLRDTPIGDEMYPWYDLSAAPLPDSIDMLVVDGPPGNTGPNARFPAVPMLRGRLGQGSTVFLDDARRADEEATVERWCSEYSMRLVADVRFTTGTAELVPEPSP